MGILSLSTVLRVLISQVFMYFAVLQKGFPKRDRADASFDVIHAVGKTQGVFTSADDDALDALVRCCDT